MLLPGRDQTSDRVNIYNGYRYRTHHFKIARLPLSKGQTQGRKINDWQNGYIEGAHHIYTGEVPEKLAEIPRDIKVVVYCDSGYKSTLVCSYLRKNGYANVTSVLGSMNAWNKADYPVVND